MATAQLRTKQSRRYETILQAYALQLRQRGIVQTINSRYHEVYKECGIGGIRAANFVVILQQRKRMAFNFKLVHIAHIRCSSHDTNAVVLAVECILHTCPIYHHCNKYSRLSSTVTQMQVDTAAITNHRLLQCDICSFAHRPNLQCCDRLRSD
jgi:hypothetical protein